TRRCPLSTLFPYTTLFRSDGARCIAWRKANSVAGETVPSCWAYAMPRPVHRVRLFGYFFMPPSTACTALRVSPDRVIASAATKRSEEHTSELQSLAYLVCR